MDNIYT